MTTFEEKQNKAIETFFKTKSFRELAERPQGNDVLSGTEKSLLVAFAAGYKIGYEEATS